IGGLPGDGWDGETKLTVDSRREGDEIVFQPPGDGQGSGRIRDGKLLAFDPDGTQVGDLSKIERKSPTLGKKPPEGAVVLFDGKSADNFKGGRMTDDGLLMQGCMSKETFQSFNLHLEFQLSFMPYASGQGRSNSGVYMQGRYETQVLDSFGLEGKHNECGGIYSVKDPDVNMCLPPLSWQTYDVQFTTAKFDDTGKKTANARMTVLLNGVKVHDDVEVDHSTTASPLKEGPEPGPIYIQDHGNPLRFRNIWVVPTDR
ncbi:MAG: 3-keto-disaccharide hydrolase, partial [Planctomycetota bacterium]